MAHILDRQESHNKNQSGASSFRGCAALSLWVAAPVYLGCAIRCESPVIHLALPGLAAATKIWRRMFDSEKQLAADALKFMKDEVGKRW